MPSFLAAPATRRQLVASKPADDHLPTLERIENQDGSAKITGGAEFFEQWRGARDCSLDTAAGRHSFVLDSGATVHATGNRRLLSRFTQLPRDEGAVDDIALGKFHLPRVRYVPGLGSGYTLVSVPQLAQRDYLVVFGGGCCYVKDPAAGGRLLGKGRLNRDDG